MLEQLGLIGTIRDEDPSPDEAETESEQEVSRIQEQTLSDTVKSMELVTAHRRSFEFTVISARGTWCWTGTTEHRTAPVLGVN